MTKAINDNTTSPCAPPNRRRALLTGAAALAAAAIGAPTARAATGADKQIIALCGRLCRLEDQRHALFERAEDDARDAALDRIGREQTALVGRLAGLKASSPAAVAAVVRALVAWAPDLVADPADDQAFVENRLLGWVSANAAALDRRAA